MCPYMFKVNSDSHAMAISLSRTRTYIFKKCMYINIIEKQNILTICVRKKIHRIAYFSTLNLLYMKTFPSKPI